MLIFWRLLYNAPGLPPQPPFLQEKLVIPSPSHCNSEGITCDRLCLSKGRLVHQYAGEIFYYVGSWQQIDFVCIGNQQGEKKRAFFEKSES